MTSKTKPSHSDTVMRLANDAAANAVKLMQCPRHLYDMANYDGPSNPPKCVPCIRCQGRHATHAALAYIDGYVATGRPLADVTMNTHSYKGVPARCQCPRCEGKSAPEDVRAWPEGQCALCDSVGSLPRARAIEWMDSKRGK